MQTDFSPSSRGGATRPAKLEERSGRGGARVDAQWEQPVPRSPRGEVGEVVIDVLAAFTASGIRPLALRMGGRRYEPLHVHLTHTVREGRKRLRIFSVTDGPPATPEDGNHFTLAFDSEDCRWRMWKGD